MKKLKTLFLTILAVVVFALCVACGGDETPKPSVDEPEAIDYARQITLDLTSDSLKQEVTVRLYVDGDTTHFDPVRNPTLTADHSSEFGEAGYIKARYIAINTPESTGKIEQYGGKASKFTRGRLEKATSIIVESDDDQWNMDGNGRHILWIWYKTADSTEYRNLNIEILQEGLALGSSVSNNRYGQTAFNAMVQAQELAFNLFSGKKDPDFPGDAIFVTMKELRCNIADYNNKRVKVEGLVTSEFNNCVYVEDEDPETHIHYGIQVYYGYDNPVLTILQTGNRVSVVGVITEFNGSYQISDIKYKPFKPNDPNNTQLIPEDDDDYITFPLFTEVSAKNIVEGKQTVSWIEEGEDEDGNPTSDLVEKEFDYGFVTLHTSVSVSNLKVIDTYTTKTGNSKGAISLTCQSLDDGTTITVRTEVLTDDDGNVIEASLYAGKTINVKGIVDYYKQDDAHDGQYQVKVYHYSYIEILN